MVFRILPLFAGLLPLVAMFGAYWLGVSSDVLPSCIPFVDGCVSISATGRKPPGSFLFRAVMLPQAVLLAAVWYCTVLWLRSLNPALGRSISTEILKSCLVGALALIFYVTFLGTREPLYEFMRRIGIYFGFLGLALAQLMTAIALYRFSKTAQHTRLPLLANTMLGMTMVVFALGILNMLLKAVFEDDTAIENRIEWIVSILMQSYFLVMFLAWRATGFSVLVATRRG